MPVKRTRDVFRAVSDPRRRLMIELLSRKRMTVGEIKKHFDISGPAIFEQMNILDECQLLVKTLQGKKKYYRINTNKLNRIITWIEKLKRK
jgi:DNA-binding transcriptional ArsR family regulator